MTHRFALLLAGALAGACDGHAGTSVHLRIDYDAEWALTELEVSSEGRRARVEVSREVRIHLPDDYDGRTVEIVVAGIRESTRYAAGRTEVEITAGQTREAHVVLTRIPCGAWCTDGTRRCEGDSIALCARRDDGCFEWRAAPAACPAETPTCSLGECRIGCVDECATTSERSCDGPRNVRACGQADSDRCLDWLPSTPCPDGETCRNGQCRAECVHECEEGAFSCQGAAVVQCADLDVDGCREWGPPQGCGADETCQQGQCVARDACEDECSADECGGDLYRRCGQFDLDACREPSAGTPCTATDACVEGRCTLEGCMSAPRICREPPPPTCIDSNTLRVFDAVGTCEAGACNYVMRDQPCPSCPSCLPCDGVTCNTPPSACYASAGTCTDGACNYEPLTGTQCDDGNACTAADTCTGGFCLGTQVICDQPPAPTCVDGRTLRTYLSPGTCDAAGACTYASRDTTCAQSCAGGRCVDVCDGIACNEPPSACHVPYGTCDAASGECRYAFADGASCSDGNPSTVGDRCASGVCAGVPCAFGTCPERFLAYSSSSELLQYDASGWSLAVAQGSGGTGDGTVGFSRDGRPYVFYMSLLNVCLLRGVTVASYERACFEVRTDSPISLLPEGSGTMRILVHGRDNGRFIEYRYVPASNTLHLVQDVGLGQPGWVADSRAIASSTEDVFVSYQGPRDYAARERSIGTNGWSAAVSRATSVENERPALVAQGSEVILVYKGSDTNLYYAVRSNGSWSPAARTYPTAAGDPSAAPLRDGRVVVAFRGNDRNAYAMIGERSASGWTWGEPVLIFGSAGEVTSVACGSGVGGALAEILISHWNGTSGRYSHVRLTSAGYSTPAPVTLSSSRSTTRLDGATFTP